jgi:hypothetical protein
LVQLATACTTINEQKIYAELPLQKGYLQVLGLSDFFFKRNSVCYAIGC